MCAWRAEHVPVLPLAPPRSRSPAGRVFSAGRLQGSTRHLAQRESCDERRLRRYGISRLCASKVLAVTQHMYLNVLERFLNWLGFVSIPIWHAQLLDATMAEYFEALYDAGGSRTQATRLPCALMWARPSIPGPARRSFPSASAALAGWAKLQPPMSRPPLPRAVALGIALDLARRERCGMALAVLLMFETYARPGEILALVKESVVPGLPGAEGKARCMTLIVKASVLGIPGKTGEFDLCVPLDLNRHAWVAFLLEKWWTRLSAREPLWDFTHEQLAAAFRTSALNCQVTELRPCLYSLGHEGASHDLLVGARSMMEVQL